jgi:hypothetical protein
VTLLVSNNGIELDQAVFGIFLCVDQQLYVFDVFGFILFQFIKALGFFLEPFKRNFQLSDFVLQLLVLLLCLIFEI